IAQCDTDAESEHERDHHALPQIDLEPALHEAQSLTAWRRPAHVGEGAAGRVGQRFAREARAPWRRGPGRAHWGDGRKT
ncbi:MAG: hypothetical protein VXZ39_07025, partial [Planctomycetota bacterium]|nr:hypothetical protein [Planctomycetota bacterium]